MISHCASDRDRECVKRILLDSMEDFDLLKADIQIAGNGCCENTFFEHHHHPVESDDDQLRKVGASLRQRRLSKVNILDYYLLYHRRATFRILILNSRGHSPRHHVRLFSICTCM